MRSSHDISSSNNSFPEVNDSSLNSNRQSYGQNVNVSGRKSFQQNQNNFESERLNSIIAKTFEDLNDGEVQVSIQETEYENERKKLDFETIYSSNQNKCQLGTNVFFNNQNQTQSIINSSNKGSFQRVKWPNLMRVPGKLTHSSDSMGKNELNRREDEDYYYNYTIKNSTLNSQYLFNEPYYDHPHNYEGLNNDKLWQTQSDQFNNPSYSQTQYIQPSKSSQNSQQKNEKLPPSNRSGFIKQNQLNSRSKRKPKQIVESKSSHTSRKNNGLISQHQQFEVHSNKHTKTNKKNRNSQTNKQHTNQILDDEFWRKVDDQKSAVESLKQTFDSSKTNNYQINSHSQNDFSIKTKDRTHYSDIGKDKHFQDSICSSEPNPFIKEYENDLFDFIKKDLINTNVENKQLSQKEHQFLTQYNAQKMKNLNLYHLYKKTKLQFMELIDHERHSIETLESQVKLLKDQILFYKHHSNIIEQSIAIKIKKQDDFYFQHKTNLQQIILSNNQQITDLKNELFEIQHINQSREFHNNHKKTEDKSHEKNTLNFSKTENQILKLQLKEEQQLYEKAQKRVKLNNKNVHQLQKKKAAQIKALVQEFQIAKRFLQSHK